MRMSKDTADVIHDEIEDSMPTMGMSDRTKQRESVVHNHFDNYRMSIEHEDLSVSYQEDANKMAFQQKNSHRIIGRGAANNQTNNVTTDKNVMAHNSHLHLKDNHNKLGH